MTRFQLGRVWPVAALSILGAALHLPNLRALPVFNDEAIYLRCAQIFRSNPAHYLWISLTEQRPPLHIWLLGLFLPISRDPVLAGRLLSVLAAVLTVPVLYALCRTLVPAAPRVGALLACAIFATSPFFHLHDRMARVESLFVLEMVTVTWLGLRLVGSLRAGRPIAARVLILGLALGLTLLTRQAVSYVLCGLPVIAWVFRPSVEAPESERRLGSLALSLALAGLLALALWLPLLLANGGPSLMARILPMDAVHEAASKEGWIELTLRNSRDAVAWLWLYLTPPIAALAIGSLLWLALSRSVWLVVFLLAWIALLLGPAVPFANAFFPRYVLPAAIPLVIGAGFGAARLAGKLGRVGGGFAVAALLTWPLVENVRQTSNWKTQTLARVDHWQFVSGWPAGLATEEAIRYLEVASKQRHIVVVTSPDSGNPRDSLWLMLSDSAQVHLLSAASNDQALFDEPAGLRDMIQGLGDVRMSPDRTNIPVSDTPVFYVSRETTYTRNGFELAEHHWRRSYPTLEKVARFANLPSPDGSPGDAVCIYRLR